MRKVGSKKLIGIAVIIILLATGAYFLLGDKLWPNNSEQQIRSVVTEFGKNIQKVSLTTSREETIHAIKDAYAPFSSQNLIEAWTTNPERAPGVLSTDHWPDRIEIISIDPGDDGAYEVQAKVIEVAGIKGTTTVSQYPLALILRNQASKWTITGVTKALSQ